MSTSTGHGLHVVISEHPAYIRTKHKSWCIGTLYRNQEFDVQGEEAGYYWGYAFGNFMGHGWVNKKALAPKHNPHDGLHAPVMSPRDFSIHHYAGAHTLKDAQKYQLTIHVRVTHGTYLYGNYRHGRVSDSREHFIHTHYAGLPELVGWRYLTKDGRFSMVRHERLNLWGFIWTRFITMPVRGLYHRPEPEVIGFLPLTGWGGHPFGAETES